MSFAFLQNHLRTHRKRAGLSQDEVAFLLGSKSGARICRYERFRQSPNLETLLAYEILFRTPVQKLFPGIHSKLEREVAKRICLLINNLTKVGQDRLTEYKIRTLTALSKQAVSAGGVS